MGHIHYHWSNRSSTTSLDTLGNLPFEDSGIEYPTLAFPLWLEITNDYFVPWGFHHTEVAIGQGFEKLLLGKGRPKSGREGLKLHLLKQKENRTSSLTELGNGILCPHWLAPGMAALRLWGLLLWEEAQVSMPASTVLQPLENPSALALVLFLLKQNT